ncbi:MAG: hypothetical protein AAGI52_17695 [Bacteroidota bacterium]
MWRADPETDAYQFAGSLIHETYTHPTGDETLTEVNRPEVNRAIVGAAWKIGSIDAMDLRASGNTHTLDVS